MPQLYTYFKDAAEKGQGYTEGHFPTYEYFYYSLKDAHGFVMEDKVTGGFACYVTFTNTRFSRSTSSKFYGSHIMINPNYRRNNLGGFCLSFSQGIAYELGYQGGIVESLMNNIAMFNALRSMPGECVRIGYLPCVDNIGKLKVSSCLLYYKFPSEAVPRFSDSLQHTNIAKL